MKPLKSITLIDDETIVNFVNQRVLEKMEVCENVQVFNMASEALASLTQSLQNNEELPELMFVDINMPEMNGWEFVDRFCSNEELRKRITVYMLSSAQDKEEITRAENSKCVKGFIGKPLTKEKVLEVINSN